MRACEWAGEGVRACARAGDGCAHVRENGKGSARMCTRIGREEGRAHVREEVTGSARMCTWRGGEGACLGLGREGGCAHVHVKGKWGGIARMRVRRGREMRACARGGDGVGGGATVREEGKVRRLRTCS